MNFNVGDTVRVIKSPSQPQFVGEITTVISVDNNWKDPFETALGVDEDGGWWYPAYCLERIDDNYNGLSITTWDECPPEFHPDNFKVTV